MSTDMSVCGNDPHQTAQSKQPDEPNFQQLALDSPALNYLRMRLFVGIPLAPEVLAELAKAVSRLRSNSDNSRWTAPESWHITLQFLGNTDPQQYECLVAHLSEVQAPPFPIHLANLGFFDRAGVFFADVEPTPALVAVAARVSSATSLCGFSPETRPFHPHITLARAKGQSRGQPLQALVQRVKNQPAFPRFRASEFLLYESHLSPTGSTYEIRHRFPLHPTTPSPSSLSPYVPLSLRPWPLVP
jgi:2'-5' RNA ligase